MKKLPEYYDIQLNLINRRITSDRPNRIALQLPEGLLGYSEDLCQRIQDCSDIDFDIIVIGDVAYGACCIADIQAFIEGADLLIHFGHSCLVSVEKCIIPCLYILLQIRIEQRFNSNGVDFSQKLCKSLQQYPIHSNDRVILGATVQYIHLLDELQEILVTSGKLSLNTQEF